MDIRMCVLISKWISNSQHLRGEMAWQGPLATGSRWFRAAAAHLAHRLPSVTANEHSARALPAVSRLDDVHLVVEKLGHDGVRDIDPIRGNTDFRSKAELKHVSRTRHSTRHELDRRCV